MLPSCRSCGRNIASGVVRCANCGTPFHFSCSHRYKISPEGVFKICCGSGKAAASQSIFTEDKRPMRTRRNNKRKQTNVSCCNNNANSNNNVNRTTPVAVAPVATPAISLNNSGPMRYTKVLKVDPGMGINEKPLILDEENDCNEIISQDYIENENDNTNEFGNDIEVQSNESIIILDNEEQNENSSQVSMVNNSTNKQDKHSITLETVWEGISSLQSSISNISNSLDTVSTHLNTFDPRINELESTLNTIKNTTNNFENVQNDVSGLKDELSRITNELEDIKTVQREKNISVSEIFIEIKEREMKAKNVIIYNVPEDNLRISQDYSTVDDINQFNALVNARDNSRAREILQNVPNVNLDKIMTRRLGRVRPNFVRPLRVTLQDRSDVITIMKNKTYINDQYTVKTDLTKLQQRKIKELKEEIATINIDKEHPTVTIKFINGEPQIIPIGNIGNNYFKRE